MSLYIRAVQNDLSADAAIRVKVVESTGESFFQECGGIYYTLEDLVRLLVEEGEDGKNYLRISV